MRPRRFQELPVFDGTGTEESDEKRGQKYSSFKMKFSPSDVDSLAEILVAAQAQQATTTVEDFEVRNK